MMSPPTSTSCRLEKTAEYADAVVVPNVARALLALLIERGFSAERVSRGLGFDYDDLLDLNMRLSYRQTRRLITRAQKVLQDPALGFSVGMRQTPVSWGVAGLAMLTCRTLGEAMTYGLEHQGDTGALLEHRATVDRGKVIIEVKPRIFDMEIEPFLVEEAFSSAVAIVRRLVGPAFSPSRVELSFPRPAHAAAYQHAFRCPVVFSVSANRLISEAHWLSVGLPDYDEITCGPLRAQLDNMLGYRGSQNDLVETLSSHLRAHVDDRQPLQTVASQLNVSERTLRRRLVELGVSFRDLSGRIRYERAADLLYRTDMSVVEIAQAVGFADAGSFRRAFKRWSGTLPGERRKNDPRGIRATKLGKDSSFRDDLMQA